MIIIEAQSQVSMLIGKLKNTTSKITIRKKNFVFF